jgi:hypothetical protein
LRASSRLEQNLPSGAMNRLLRTIFPKLFIVMVVVAQPEHTFHIENQCC